MLPKRQGIMVALCGEATLGDEKLETTDLSHKIVRKGILL